VKLAREQSEFAPMLPMLLFAADPAGTLVINDRTDVRGRITISGAPGQSAAVNLGLDLLNTPSATMVVGDHRWTLSLGYTPSFQATDLELGFTPQIFQTLYASIGWHYRFVSLSIGDSASYGTFNSSYLFQPGAPAADSGTSMTPQTGPASTPMTTLQLAPQPQTVYFGSNRTNANLSVQTDRRTFFSLGASYGLAGGLDESSRSLEPPMTTVEGDASLFHKVSRVDSLTTAASAQDVKFTDAPCLTPDGALIPNVTCQPDSQLFLLNETYGHALDAATTLSVGGGPAFVRSRTTDNMSFGTTWYPAAEVSFVHRYARLGLANLLVNAVLQPAADYRTGLVTDRAQVYVAATDIIDSKLSVTVDVSAGQTIPLDSPIAATIIRAETQAEYRFDKARELAILWGLSSQWQTQNPFGYFFTIFGFAALSISTPPLRY
jgi:hypothetical protein